MSLENYNYARDPRTQGPAKKPVLYIPGPRCQKCGEEPTQISRESDQWRCAHCGHFAANESAVDWDIEVELPTKWTVCPVCDGEGKHVNPSIDCGGISASEFHDNPDFAEDYMRGTYDVTCSRCKGRTTIQIADLDAMTSEQRALYTQQLIDEARDHQERLAEIRAGC